jgi:hypothetical protein
MMEYTGREDREGGCGSSIYFDDILSHTKRTIGLVSYSSL